MTADSHFVSAEVYKPKSVVVDRMDSRPGRCHSGRNHDATQSDFLSTKRCRVPVVAFFTQSHKELVQPRAIRGEGVLPDHVFAIRYRDHVPLALRKTGGRGRELSCHPLPRQETYYDRSHI